MARALLPHNPHAEPSAAIPNKTETKANVTYFGRLSSRDWEGFRTPLWEALQDAPEGEMSVALGAVQGERIDDRLG